MQLFIETPEMRARRLERDGAVPVSGQARADESRSARASALFDSVASTRDRVTRHAEVDASYSLEQETYQDARAYDRRRARRRMRTAVLTVVGSVVLVPVALIIVFVGAYALTCILDGASPDELGALLVQLARDAQGLVADALGSR